MKFKNKNGKVLDGVVAFRGDFCCNYGTDEHGNCIGCPVGIRAEHKLCERWIHENPAEAARLMGYEVVDDREKIADGKGGWYYKKEANMDKQKPRICEVLGVEVGERFNVYGNCMDWHVDEKGYIVSDIGNRCVDDVIYIAINKPDKIIRKPRAEEKDEPMKQDKPLSEWTLGELKAYCHKNVGDDCERCRFKFLCDLYTDADGAYICVPGDWNLTEKPRFTQEEVADARALLSMFRQKWERIERQPDNGLVLCYNDVWMIPLNNDLFPSILPGTSVAIGEIVGE